MGKAAQPPMVYGVIVFRTDGEHIIVMEDPNYDKCFEHWKMLHTEWAQSAKELRPFVLLSPEVTAFSPTMIYEVKLVPRTTSVETASKSHNPYYNAMNEKGLARSFPGQPVDLLQR